jgi:hypothetical protein
VVNVVKMVVVLAGAHCQMQVRVDRAARKVKEPTCLPARREAQTASQHCLRF